MGVDDDNPLRNVMRDIDEIAKRLGLKVHADKFILDGHTPVPVDDVLVWGRWFEHSHEQRIVRQERIGDYFISTVFIGLDHSFRGHGPPLLFETMVFIEVDGKRESDGCERYSTWDEALAGHLIVCERIRQSG